MIDEESILAAADAIRKKSAPEYLERASSISELEQRLATLKAEQAAVDEEAADAMARLEPKNVNTDPYHIPQFAKPSAGAWTPRDDHDIFAVEHFDEFSPKPNGAMND